MNGMFIKCESCGFMDWVLRYCHKLQHPIENGYAMLCHSEHCDEVNIEDGRLVAENEDGD